MEYFLSKRYWQLHELEIHLKDISSRHQKMSISISVVQTLWSVSSQSFYTDNCDNCPLQLALRSQGGTTLSNTLETLYDSLVVNRPCSFEDCITWARFQFEDLFSNNIKQLLYSYVYIWFLILIYKVT